MDREDFKNDIIDRVLDKVMHCTEQILEEIFYYIDTCLDEREVE